ncbi:hypothetical protein BKA81DRAFT_401837 [Phyllosticta paracitricarpa]
MAARLPADLADQLVLLRNLRPQPSSTSPTNAATSKCVTGFLVQFHKMRTLFKQHSLQITKYLDHDTLDAVCVAEATFGRTKPLVLRLSRGPWAFGLDQLRSAFSASIFLSLDFLTELDKFATASGSLVARDTAVAAIGNARDKRTGKTGRPGVSVKRDWTPKDVKDAASTLQSHVSTESRTKRRPENEPAKACPITLSTCRQPASPSPPATTPKKPPGLPPAAEHSPLSNRSAKRRRLSPPNFKNIRSFLGAANPLATIIEASPSSSIGSLKRRKLPTATPDEVEFPRKDISAPRDDHDDQTFGAYQSDSSDAGDFVGDLPSDSSVDMDADAVVDFNTGSLAGSPESHLFNDDQMPDTPNKRCIGREGEDGRTKWALEQLDGSNWLGHTAIWEVLSRFNVESRARLIDVGWPPTTAPEWREWAQKNRFPVAAGCEVVIFPLHLAHRQHWSLITLDMVRRQATMTDSMRDDNEDPNLFEARGQALIRSVGVEDVDSWLLQSRENAPQQNGGNDCGVYVLVNCLYAMQCSSTGPQHIDPALWRFVFKYALDGSVGDERIMPRPSIADSDQSSDQMTQFQAHRNDLARFRTFERAADETMRTLAVAYQHVAALPTLGELEEDLQWRKSAALSKLTSGSLIPHDEDDKCRAALTRAIRDREQQIASAKKASCSVEEQRRTVRRVFDLAAKIHKDARQLLGDTELKQWQQRVKLQDEQREAQRKATELQRCLDGDSSIT